MTVKKEDLGKEKRLDLRTVLIKHVEVEERETDSLKTVYSLVIYVYPHFQVCCSKHLYIPPPGYVETSGSPIHSI